MADTKISALPSASAIAGSEFIPGVQSGGNVRFLWSQVATYVRGLVTKADVGLGNVPNVDATNAANIASGTVALANGGTGQTTAALARNAVNKGVVALTDGATIATDCATGNVFTVTLAGNRTLANPTNMAAGATYLWIVTQDATGSRTLAYGTNFKWPGGAAPTLSTVANAVDVISAVYDGTALRAVSTLAFA